MIANCPHCGKEFKPNPSRRPRFGDCGNVPWDTSLVQIGTKKHQVDLALGRSWILFDLDGKTLHADMPDNSGESVATHYGELVDGKVQSYTKRTPWTERGTLGKLVDRLKPILNELRHADESTAKAVAKAIPAQDEVREKTPHQTVGKQLVTQKNSPEQHAVQNLDETELLILNELENQLHTLTLTQLASAPGLPDRKTLSPRVANLIAMNYVRRASARGGIGLTQKGLDKLAEQRPVKSIAR